MRILILDEDVKELAVELIKMLIRLMSSSEPDEVCLV